MNATPSSKPIVSVVTESDELFQAVVAALKGTPMEAVRQSPQESVTETAEIVLLDLAITQADSISLCEALWDDVKNQGPSVILFTSPESRENASECLAAGALDTLAKPVVPEELKAKVGVHYRLQRAEREKKALELHLTDEYNTILGTLAHDLRAPLTVILGAFEVLDWIEDPVRRQDITDRAVNRIIGMTETIDDLLHRGKIHAGKVTLNFELVELVDFIESVLNDHRPRAEQKDITIAFKPSQELMSTFSDPKRLRVVIDNLIDNAIKYSNPKAKITVTLRELDESFEIHVIDKGLGIKEDELDRVFEEFADLSNQPTSGEPSSGLGLAISQRLVRLLGGEIGLKSQVGLGSVFTVSLPKKPPASLSFEESIS